MAILQKLINTLQIYIENQEKKIKKCIFLGVVLIIILQPYYSAIFLLYKLIFYTFAITKTIGCLI